MRFSTLAATFLLLGAAAAPAQSQAPLPPDYPQLTDKLADPTFQRDLEHRMSAMVELLLALPVGPFAEMADAIDPEGARLTEIEPDATLGDLAGADAAELPREMAIRTRALTGMMGALAHSFAVMLPHLRALGDAMEGELEAAAREFEPAR